MMRIVAASSADADTLAGLNQYVQNLHLENAPQFFKLPIRERATAAFKALLDRDDARAFIAYNDGRAIGYVLVFLVDRPETAFVSARRWLYLDQISVEPNSRRQGVGRALLNAALGCARAAGIDEIEVETWSFNAVAQVFFKSYGFAPKTEQFWLKLRV
jgi:ribosomal protein S18 acetylase RimI-like enzyme